MQRKITSPAITSVAHGVADRECERLHGRLSQIITVLKTASLKDRLVYLLTKKIPPTKAMKMSCKAFHFASYEEWLR